MGDLDNEVIADGPVVDEDENPLINPTLTVN